MAACHDLSNETEPDDLRKSASLGSEGASRQQTAASCEIFNETLPDESQNKVSLESETSSQQLPEQTVAAESCERTPLFRARSRSCPPDMLEDQVEDMEAEEKNRISEPEVLCEAKSECALATDASTAKRRLAKKKLHKTKQDSNEAASCGDQAAHHPEKRSRMKRRNKKSKMHIEVVEVEDMRPSTGGLGVPAFLGPDAVKADLPEENRQELDDGCNSNRSRASFRDTGVKVRESVCRLKAQITQQAHEAADEFAVHFRGKLEMEVVNESPQVGVLWASCTECDDLPVLLIRQDVVVRQLMLLPKSDCCIFVAERPASFLRKNQCGSAASEAESIRIAILRALKFNSISGVDMYMWPIHDMKFNRMLLAKVLTADGLTHHKVKRSNLLSELAVRMMVWLGLSFDRQSELTSAVQAQFGSDVALSLLFTLHYIKTLWYLALFALIFHILKSSLDRSLYLSVFCPIFQFGILFPWSLCFVVKWCKRLQEASKAWMADLLEDDTDVYTEVCPEFKAWERDGDPLYYPTWMRILWTLPVVPLLALDILLMMIVLVGVFWAEMWIVFDWGRCSEINARNGNTDCQGADEYWGFGGALFEAVPGIVEGILFELLLALSKALARLAVWLQNWQTVTQKELAYIVQLVIFEFIGKFGWIGLLAICFVPDFEDASGSKDVVFFQSEGCSDWTMRYWDSQLFALFGLGDQSLTCLKSRTKYETRLALFEIAVAAPFFVSQIVSMCIKTVVPLIVIKFRACYPNDHGAGAGCPCKCGRALLRFLSCICLFDVEQVGVNECNYLAQGDLIGEEIFLQCCRQEGLAPSHQTLLNPRPLLLTAWAEGLREPFKALDENLETVMHFFWVISFAAFFPLGVVLGLAIYVFDVRTDLFRLTLMQRRNFRNPPQATLIMLQRCMTVAVACAAAFNVFVTFVTYGQLSRWSRSDRYHKDRGLLSYFGTLVAVIVGCISLLLIVQIIVHKGAAVQDARRLQATNRSSRIQRKLSDDIGSMKTGSMKSVFQRFRARKGVSTEMISKILLRSASMDAKCQGNAQTAAREQSYNCRRTASEHGSRQVEGGEGMHSEVYRVSDTAKPLVLGRDSHDAEVCEYNVVIRAPQE